jgi:hypothetical protein
MAPRIAWRRRGAMPISKQPLSPSTPGYGICRIDAAGWRGHAFLQHHGLVPTIRKKVRTMIYVDYVHLARDFIINAVGLYLYAYVIIFYKYGNKELFVTCTLFNVFVLLVVMTIVRTDFTLAVGFGLFALLALIQVRSVTFTKTEMAYFFGGIAMAVINGSGIADYVFVIIANCVVVLSAWCISSWSIDHSANIFDMQFSRRFAVVFDHIDTDATDNPTAMIRKLKDLFKLDVANYSIKQIDYVRDTMDIVITHNIHRDGVQSATASETLNSVPRSKQVDASS